MNLPHNDSPRIRQSCIILGLVLIGLLRAIGPELGKYKQCCFNNHLITLVKLRPSSSDVVKLMFLSVKLEKSSLLYCCHKKKLFLNILTLFTRLVYCFIKYIQDRCLGFSKIILLFLVNHH